MLTFQPIILDANHGDEEAVLVLHCERLLAVATRLSSHHEAAAGEWFVEAVFNDRLPVSGQRCASLEDMQRLLERAF